MSKKIEWIKRGMTANNGLHMQEVCDQIADATAEIHNSLQKPTTTPSATQIVAVDNTNTQTMLNIGDGLSVENGSLKASGGTGGTGNKLYYKKINLHFLNIVSNFEQITDINIYFYETNDTLYDTSNIQTLYTKIPYAICETPIASIMSDSAFACAPSINHIKFYMINNEPDGARVKTATLSFDKINDTDVRLMCFYTEV